MTTASQPPQDKSPTEPRATFSHSLPALVVLIMLVVTAVYADRRATYLENRFGRTFARLMLEQNELGIVVQQAAFRQPDLLPVYGSSEILASQTPYRAFYFFDNHPTGFNVFDVARNGSTSLTMAMDLATIGTELRGKKFVISFTPSMFTFPQVSKTSYGNNFSRSHANGLIFNNQLSLSIKKRAAGRMLAYPDPLETDPVLGTALQNLAQDDTYHDLIYLLISPLGQLDNFILRLQDHYAIWESARGLLLKDTGIKHRNITIDWNAEITSAETLEKLRTNSNPYGVPNHDWKNPERMDFEFHEPGSQDNIYLAKLEKSKEWEDFRILLEVIRELGGKPLIMSRPINGTIYTASGISPQAQLAFYNKLNTVVARYNFPLVDFQDRTTDRFFSWDFNSHTSPKGWVIVNQVLDGYYHDQNKIISAGVPISQPAP